jgi:murein DD-endopeptidase MepM/ murein hydrolase activator NlpD
VFNPDQRHAVDLVGWREGGSHADNEGEHDEDYAIWDALVKSPVDGTIVSVENDADDHVKPQKEMTDDQHPFGNVVMIRIADSAPELYVVLGHMRKGSVVVSAGMQVKKGDPIGRVGNSGNSSEPHLHVHVQDGPVIKAGYSVPFVINDRAVLRGQMIDVR